MFVRGGVVNPGDYLDFTGNNGNYWSSVGRNSSSAYYLFFYPDGVYLSYINYRYFGFPLRCVALGGWVQICPKIVKITPKMANFAPKSQKSPQECPFLPF